MQLEQEHDPIPPHNARRHMPLDSVGICEKKKKREWIVSYGQKRNNKVTKYLSFFAYCILINTFVVVVGFVAFYKAFSGSTLTDKSHYQEMQHY